MINSTVSSPKRELFYLLCNTSGPSNALVKICQCLSDDEGYAKAKRLLKDTVGQVFQIARSCIHLVVNGLLLKVHDKIGLINIAAELTSYITGINYWHKIDNKDIKGDMTGAATPDFNSLIPASSVPSLASTEPVELFCRASNISTTVPFRFIKHKQDTVEIFLLFLFTNMRSSA